MREGIELEDRGLLKYDARMFEIAVPFLKQYAMEFAGASTACKVPVELIMACALTQSPDGPQKFVWRAPGYVGDYNTPDRISAGICRMPLWTAHFYMKDETLDHHWMLDVNNALRVCAASIYFHFVTVRTTWDPILVACAFNAGGLYQDSTPGNIWRMKQYNLRLGFPASKPERLPDPDFAERFARQFSAARQLVDDGLLEGREFVGFGRLFAES
jgi:hypothetical protein